MDLTKINKLDRGTFLYILIIGSVLLLSLYIFIEIVDELRESELDKFDHTIIQYIQSHISEGLTGVMKVITSFGSIPFLTFGVIAGSFATILSKRIEYCFFIIVTSGIGAIFNYSLKAIFARQRPDILPLIEQHGYSFPSGHSMGSFIFYGSLVLVAFRIGKSLRLKLIALTFFAIVVLLIGLSRIYLGVHFPSDIIAGYAAGAVWLIAAAVGLRYYEFRRHLKRD